MTSLSIEIAEASAPAPTYSNCFENGYTDLGPGFEHMKAMTDRGLEADIHASYQSLEDQGQANICSSGYSTVHGAPHSQR